MINKSFTGIIKRGMSVLAVSAMIWGCFMHQDTFTANAADYEVAVFSDNDGYVFREAVEKDGKVTFIIDCRDGVYAPDEVSVYVNDTLLIEGRNYYLETVSEELKLFAVVMNKSDAVGKIEIYGNGLTEDTVFNLYSKTSPSILVRFSNGVHEITSVKAYSSVMGVVSNIFFENELPEKITVRINNMILLQNIDYVYDNSTGVFMVYSVSGPLTVHAYEAGYIPPAEDLFPTVTPAPVVTPTPTPTAKPVLPKPTDTPTDPPKTGDVSSNLPLYIAGVVMLAGAVFAVTAFIKSRRIMKKVRQ